MRTVGIVIAALVAAAIGLVACGAVLNLLGMEEVGWDGETYTVKLVNDTGEPLEFAHCIDGAA